MDHRPVLGMPSLIGSNKTKTKLVQMLAITLPTTSKADERLKKKILNVVFFFGLLFTAI